MSVENSYNVPVSIHSSCYSRNTKHSNKVWSLGSPRSRLEGQIGIWWRPTSWFADNHLLPGSLHGRRGDTSEGFFVRALIPFMKVPHSLMNHIPKAPPPNTIILWLGFNKWILRDKCSVSSSSWIPGSATCLLLGLCIPFKVPDITYYKTLS